MSGRAKRVISRVALLVASVSLSLALPQTASASVYGRGNVSSPYAGTTTGTEQEAQTTEMSISEMLQSSATADGTLVSFSAEAIGDEIEGQDGYKWVNVESDGDMIGVYMTPEQTDSVTSWGEYGVTGTELRIVGELHTSCAEHGGEFDVHADSVAVVSPGEAVSTPVSRRKVWAAAGFLVAGLLVWSLYSIRKRSLR